MASLALGCGEDPAAVAPISDRLVFLVEPTSVVAGAPISPTVQVGVLRSDGTLSTDQPTVVQLALADGAERDTLRGITSGATVTGVASFPSAALRRVGTGVTLVATAPGLAGAVSQRFDVRAAPPAALRVTSSPTAGTVGAALAPALVVAVDDSLGNPVTTTGTLEATIRLGPLNGAITAGQAIRISGATGSFAGLRLSLPGTYVLEVSLAGQPGVRTAVSSPIVVAP